MCALMKNQIQSISNYNERMAASITEKTFFFAYLSPDIEVIVDFGCANALMLEQLRNGGIEIEYIGYDINPNMADIATKNANEKGFKNFSIVSQWEAVEELITNRRAALLLSSVIHEVYSYGTNQEVEKFWDIVFNERFKKIFVRDMMYSEKMPKYASLEDVYKIKSGFSTFLIAQWEQHWGPLTDYKSMLHFLLTYHYVDNWTREYLENYFPISLEKFIEKINKTVYQVDLFHPHKVPYLESKIKNDFNIDLAATTHVVAVLSKPQD